MAGAGFAVDEIADGVGDILARESLSFGGSDEFLFAALLIDDLLENETIVGALLVPFVYDLRGGGPGLGDLAAAEVVITNRLIGQRRAEFVAQKSRGLRCAGHIVSPKGENLDAGQRHVSRVGIFDLFGAVDGSRGVSFVTLADLRGQHLGAIRFGEPREQRFGQVVAPDTTVEGGGHLQHAQIWGFHRIDGFDGPIHPREDFCFLRLGELRHRLSEDRRSG